MQIYHYVYCTSDTTNATGDIELIIQPFTEGEPFFPDLFPKPFIFLWFTYTGQRHFPEIQVFGSKNFCLESTGIMATQATPFSCAVKTATYIPADESIPILCPILQQTLITSVFLQYSYHCGVMHSHHF